MNFCPEEALADPCTAGNGFRRHPDIDAEPRHFRFPDMLVEIVSGEFTRETKFSADRLADPAPIQGPGKRVGETVRDCAVVFVTQIVGSDIVVSFCHDWAK